MWRLNPHPLKPEGAAPGAAERLERFLVGLTLRSWGDLRSPQDDNLNTSDRRGWRSRRGYRVEGITSCGPGAHASKLRAGRCSPLHVPGGAAV